MSLNRDSILGVRDAKVLVVDVPEWGGAVHLRSMSGRARDSFEAEAIERGKMDYANIRARLLVRCICDEQGELLFTESDAGALGEKSAAVLDRLFAEAQKLSGLSRADVDELAKN